MKHLGQSMLPTLALLSALLAAEVSPISQPNEAAAVYAAVIDSVRQEFGRRPVGVIEQLRPFGVFADTGIWARAFGPDSTGIGRELWREWVAASQESGRCPCPAVLPESWYLHSASRENEEPIPFLLFSKVAFSADGRRALVGVHLGTDKMGQSRLYLVTRDSVGWRARFAPLTWSF